jgi:hypothetical protein
MRVRRFANARDGGVIHDQQFELRAAFGRLFSWLFSAKTVHICCLGL